ncbi:MAG: DNA-processing protein DprA [Myxococcales bacterium]|jgi:DNA processing protein
MSKGLRSDELRTSGQQLEGGAGSGPASNRRLTDEELAVLALFSIEGIGPATLESLRLAFGSLAEAVRVPRDRLLPLLRDDGTRARLVDAGDLAELAQRNLERAERARARVLFPGRPGWPRQLEGVAFPPLFYLNGTLAEAQRRVAIVGSRETDDYGKDLAAFFSGALARAGAGIVSGGAIGVDGAAHRAALGNSQATVAVLGSGVDVVYPEEHRGLFREIVARGGALVSHFPPGTPAVPQNFRVRNRLIAALADAVLVVRASASSGALGTAKAALALGRPLFAVPSDVTSELGLGTNLLIEQGSARAVTRLDPIGEAIGLKADWPALLAPAASAATRARSRSKPVPLPTAGVEVRRREIDVPQELRPVYEALGDSPTQFDELVAKCGLDAAGLANALLRLELMGLCEERVGKVFVRK